MRKTFTIPHSKTVSTIPIVRVPATEYHWVARCLDAGAMGVMVPMVDDAEQGVTDVVRGNDLFASTSVHRALQELLGLPAPRYHHALAWDAVARSARTTSRGVHPGLASMRQAASPAIWGVENEVPLSEV